MVATSGWSSWRPLYMTPAPNPAEVRHSKILSLFSPAVCQTVSALCMTCLQIGLYLLSPINASVVSHSVVRMKTRTYHGSYTPITRESVILILILYISPHCLAAKFGPSNSQLKQLTSWGPVVQTTHLWAEYKIWQAQDMFTDRLIFSIAHMCKYGKPLSFRMKTRTYHWSYTPILILYRVQNLAGAGWSIKTRQS